MRHQTSTLSLEFQIQDLLTHRTGLTAYDDDVWHKNDKLSREEVIKAVMSKPATARFRTTFQYNNVMYSAVGECIGRANDSTWEGVISPYRASWRQPRGSLCIYQLCNG